ncbi:unnamed protein product [Ectocarpus sp. 12 AP-2014]
MSLNQQGEPDVADRKTGNRAHRRSESEASGAFGGGPRPFSSTSYDSPRWRGGGANRQRGSGGRYGWRANDGNNASPADDENPRLVSLADLIRKEDKVPATLLYEHPGDTDAPMDARDIEAGGLTHQAMNGGAVGMQEALQAAEHGNSVRLSKFLQDGGNPDTLSRLHHLRWSLLHLAVGCSSMGGRLAFASHRRRPEPDCNDGYVTCVSELLAAGADPNITSSSLGYTPLMSAALTGSKECCWLLLRAGARLDMRADDGRTAFDFAQKARHLGGGSSGGTHDSVLDVLRDPPKKIPRSPTLVIATLAERSSLEPEEEVPPVEVRWRVPSQASLAPTVCGDVERFYLKTWCRGKGKEVIRTKTSTVDVPRRDFCRNQIIDRGIALRKNLCLPQSQTTSAIVHGLQAGDVYSFTVSCVAEVEGALRHSPPSCMSKPLLIPESKEDHQWRLGGMLQMVTGKETPSTGTTGEGGAAPQVRRVTNQSPTSIDQRRGPAKSFSVSWAKDDIAPTIDQRQPASYRVSDDVVVSPSGDFGRSLTSSASEWEPKHASPVVPLRRRSQSYASSVTRADTFLQTSTADETVRASMAFPPPSTSSPLEEGTEARPLFGDTTPHAGRAQGEMGGGGTPLTFSTNSSGFEAIEFYEDGGCSVS